MFVSGPADGSAPTPSHNIYTKAIRQPKVQACISLTLMLFFKESWELQFGKDNENPVRDLLVPLTELQRLSWRV